jgi:hypothetical protein
MEEMSLSSTLMALHRNVVVTTLETTRGLFFAKLFMVGNQRAQTMVLLAGCPLNVAAAVVCLAVAKNQHLRLMQGPSLALVTVEPQGAPRLVA